MSHHCGRYERFTNRRDFLKKAGAGFGLLALADLLQDDGLLAADTAPSQALDPMAPRPPHYPARAKSIIWLFMEGAPSSVDLFDPKPELTKRDGQRIDINVFNGNPGPLMKSPFSFKQHGQSGAWVCEKYPNVAKHVDDFAFIKSLYSESNDHVPALYQINTGIARPGFPSAGAWITYGLGSESRNLPGYVVLGNSQGVKGGPLNWSAGFLPTSYQGTLFRSSGAPILNLTRPEHVTRDDQRAQLDERLTVARAALAAAEAGVDSELAAVGAARTQAAAPIPKPLLDRYERLRARLGRRGPEPTSPPGR